MSSELGMEPIPPTRAIAPRTQLRDDAAAHIRELIVSGQADPGTLLRLAPLADEIQSSVTPVREALILLAQDGWVVQEPNRGFRVATMRRQDVADAYVVHAFAAGELASRAAVRVDLRTASTLRVIDDEVKALVQRADYSRLDELNYRFHGLIYDLAAAPRLRWFVDAAARFVPRRFWATIPGWVDFNRTDHEPIIDALAAHDVELARRRMSSHIEQAGNLLLSHLDHIQFWVEREPA